MDLDQNVAENSSPFDVGTASTVPAGEQLRLLEQQLRLRLLTGTENLKDGELESADLLRAEAAYLAENIETAIRGRASEAVALRRTCGYLGTQLHEYRWALWVQEPSYQEALTAVLDGVEPQVRECWLNAHRFLEAGDTGMARQHFAALVSVAPIRFLAHQYLGFLATRKRDYKDGLKNFDLAKRYAENDRDRAMASSHAGGVWFAAGDFMRAAKCALTAAELCSEEAEYWYETAVACARLGKREHLEEFLSNAIRRDCLYWPIAIVDPDLGPARALVAQFLGDMREQQRLAARTQLEKLREIVGILRDTEAGAEVITALEIADDLEHKFRDGSIFSYLRLMAEIPEAQKKFIRRALDGFDKRLRQLESGIPGGQPFNPELVEAKQARIKGMLEEAAEKETPSSGLTLLRTFVQVWTAFGSICTAWAIYDYAIAAPEAKSGPYVRLLWLSASLALPWIILTALIFFQHKLPAKLIRQRATDLERELKRSHQIRSNKTQEDQEKLAADLDRVLKQREMLEEYLRDLGN